MGRHSAPSDPPVSTDTGATSRIRTVGPVTDPLLLEGLVSRSRTDRSAADAPAPAPVPQTRPRNDTIRTGRTPFDVGPQTDATRRQAPPSTGSSPTRVERRAAEREAEQVWPPFEPRPATAEQPRLPADPEDDDVDVESRSSSPLPMPVRAAAAAAVTAPVPLLQHTAPASDEDEPREALLAAPSLRTQAGPAPVGAKDRPLQISWPWFGVALLAVAALSIVAVLPL